MRKGFVAPVIFALFALIIIGSIISILISKNLKSKNTSQTKTPNTQQIDSREQTNLQSQNNPINNSVLDNYVEYKNDFYGYTVQYPKGFIVSPVSHIFRGKDEYTNQAVIITNQKYAYFPETGNNLLPDKSVYIEVIPIPVDYSFQQWWLDHTETFNYLYKEFPKYAFPRENINVSFYKDDTNTLDKNKTSIIWKNNTVYLISQEDDNAGIQNNEILNNIVNSIKINPNPNSTLWKNYSNQNGISFQLPNLLSVYDQGNGHFLIDSALNGFLTNASGMNPLRFDIFPNPQNLTIPDWYKKQISTYPDYNEASAGTLTPAAIGQYNGYKRKGFGGDSDVWVYYLSNKDKIFEFQYADYPLSNNPNNNWIKTTYEQIIQSAKFTQQKTF